MAWLDEIQAIVTVWAGVASEKPAPNAAYKARQTIKFRHLSISRQFCFSFLKWGCVLKRSISCVQNLRFLLYLSRDVARFTLLHHSAEYYVTHFLWNAQFSHHKITTSIAWLSSSQPFCFCFFFGRRICGGQCHSHLLEFLFSAKDPWNENETRWIWRKQFRTLLFTYLVASCGIAAE